MATLPDIEGCGSVLTTVYALPRSFDHRRDVAASLLRIPPSRAAKDNHIHHRHHDCNETFLIWGTATRFRPMESEEASNKPQGPTQSQDMEHVQEASTQHSQETQGQAQAGQQNQPQEEQKAPSKEGQKYLVNINVMVGVENQTNKRGKTTNLHKNNIPNLYLQYFEKFFVRLAKHSSRINILVMVPKAGVGASAREIHAFLGRVPKISLSRELHSSYGVDP
ncbi:hypothetical protein Fmac_020445 [Flemingia macrophylla]|uniref:Uncharacterized protein n=1 Tax=Flemingia macrophylla TaxID=520843 RepID=A0ABD1LUP2_9FABA